MNSSVLNSYSVADTEDFEISKMWGFAFSELVIFQRHKSVNISSAVEGHLVTLELG